MTNETIMGSVLGSFLSRLAADKTGTVEMEIRFGKMHSGRQAYFQTNVSLLWFEAVKKYLVKTGWMATDETHYQQYKVGQKRVRVFADGRVEAITKRIIGYRDVGLHEPKDVRISLAKEKKVDVPELIGKIYNQVSRQTYLRGGLQFDLTQTRHRQDGQRDNRVELEVVGGLHSDLKQIIENVAAIV